VTDFARGQKVVCVNTDFEPRHFLRHVTPEKYSDILPELDREYTIASVRHKGPHDHWPNNVYCGLVLAEIDYSLGFDARAFRRAS
jgi:hypothetical protein